MSASGTAPAQTANAMTRRLAPLLLVLGSAAAFAGCGDHRLTVAGYARFETGDAFEFPT